MLILAMRTDKPDAELYSFDGTVQKDQESWQAHRELSVTIHQKIEALLERSGKTLANIEGVVFYQGPGSFTGLRIGISVANGLAAGLSIPIAATTGDDWLKQGVALVQTLTQFVAVEPLYGSDPHIIQPKK